MGYNSVKGYKRPGDGGAGAPTKDQSLNGTGISRGGIISVLSPTELEYTGGFGDIVDATNPDGDTVTRVDWVGSVYNPVLTTDGLFLLLCDSTGTFSQILNDDYTSATRRDFLTFGAFTIESGELVSATPFALSNAEPIQQFFDLLACLGTIRCSGLNISPNGSNMQLNMSSGIIHASGVGSQNTDRPQNLTEINGQSPLVFDRLLGTTNSLLDSGGNVIDPDFYDNGSGLLAPVGGANKATIKYVFLLPSPNVSVVVSLALVWLVALLVVLEVVVMLLGLLIVAPMNCQHSPM